MCKWLTDIQLLNVQVKVAIKQDDSLEAIMHGRKCGIQAIYDLGLCQVKVECNHNVDVHITLYCKLWIFCAQYFCVIIFCIK